MARLRVLSYNIHKGFCLFNRFTLHRIKEAIRETEADLCFLQEVVGHHETFRNQIVDWPTESQFEFLADTLWPHYKYGKNAVFPQRHHGNAVLSKYPILLSENFDISTNRFEQRGLLHCRIQMPEEKIQVDLLNTHLNLMHASRIRQTEKIINWVETRLNGSNPLLLAGDFNDWQGVLTPIFQQRLQLSESFLHTRGVHAKTFPSHFPVMSLDRIYYRSLTVLQERVLDHAPWMDLSDHLPLFVEFEIQSPVSLA